MQKQDLKIVKELECKLYYKGIELETRICRSCTVLLNIFIVTVFRIKVCYNINNYKCKVYQLLEIIFIYQKMQYQITNNIHYQYYGHYLGNTINIYIIILNLVYYDSFAGFYIAALNNI